ncbi:unnamed protein product [Litomosoides sigmodontis]|uniref:Phosphatidylinositol-glycan biosynthesis class X protein n=1 Tax=Litomosoides sigmodontis TaxID=42156 RepID=A0A3P6SB07_LITSI|nr:unnamed protein product [Litomosoides sigmodontis]
MSLRFRQVHMSILTDPLHLTNIVNMVSLCSTVFSNPSTAISSGFKTCASILISMKEYPTHTYIEASFDIEASREESENTSFHICSKRGLNKNFVYSEHFELPIHLRYHAASGKDAVVVVPPPQLLLRCFENSTFLTSDCKKYLVKASCDCSSESRCEWLMIPLLKYNEVQFRIPTGNVSSLKFVLFVTVSIVISCALAIIIATMKNVVKAKVE